MSIQNENEQAASDVVPNEQIAAAEATPEVTPEVTPVVDSTSPTTVAPLAAEAVVEPVAEPIAEPVVASTAAPVVTDTAPSETVLPVEAASVHTRQHLLVDAEDSVSIEAAPVHLPADHEDIADEETQLHKPNYPDLEFSNEDTAWDREPIEAEPVGHKLNEAGMEIVVGKDAPRNDELHEKHSLLERIPKNKLNVDALWVVRRLRAKGYEAYLTGGCVRDLLLSRKPKDFDVATSAHPNQVRSTFRNCRIIGHRFRLAHIYFAGNKVVETATFRANPLDALGDLPEDLLVTHDNVFGTAEQDARRRDLTINGLFYDPIDEKVIDFVGGIDDLRARVVRTIGDPDIRFREDPVRILRAIKFATRLDFRIEEKTYQAMHNHADKILRCAPARLLEELVRILRSGHAMRGLSLCDEVGILDMLIPEITDALRAEDTQLLELARRRAKLLRPWSRRKFEQGEIPPAENIALTSFSTPASPIPANPDPSVAAAVEVNPETNSEVLAAPDAAPDAAQAAAQEIVPAVELDAAPVAASVASVASDSVADPLSAEDDDDPFAAALDDIDENDAFGMPASMAAASDTVGDDGDPNSEQNAQNAAEDTQALIPEATEAEAAWTPPARTPYDATRKQRLWTLLEALDAVVAREAEISNAVALATILLPGAEYLQQNDLEIGSWLERVVDNWGVRLSLTRGDREHIVRVLLMQERLQPIHRRGTAAKQLTQRGYFREGLLLYTMSLFARRQSLDEIAMWKAIAASMRAPYQQNRLVERSAFLAGYVPAAIRHPREEHRGSAQPAPPPPPPRPNNQQRFNGPPPHRQGPQGHQGQQGHNPYGGPRQGPQGGPRRPSGPQGGRRW